MTRSPAATFLAQLCDGSTENVQFIGSTAMPSAYAVTDFAAAAIAAAAVSAGRLAAQLGGTSDPDIVVDRGLAALWFASSFQPLGWTVPPAWDPLAGDHLAADGWIRLHTNAPHHRRAALTALALPDDADRAAVAQRVHNWDAGALEAAVVDAGGCAAMMRTEAEWAGHPQGAAVAAEPLVHRQAGSHADRAAKDAPPTRPLAGVRVLDLTRVLAGPVATRLLAALGADVLRVDPVDWNEPALEPEVTLGKRCTRLELRTDAGRNTFDELLRQADIIVHGYRPGALDALGLDVATRQAMSPGLIDISLDAYGWTGPWKQRRGFDSLVQMSCGIAAAGMIKCGANQPVPLPMQALDHATGYLLASEALRGWSERLTTGKGCTARASLARTAQLLVDGPTGTFETTVPDPAHHLASTETTPWGPIRRLRFAAEIVGVPVTWAHGTSTLGSEPRAAFLQEDA